MSFLNQSLLKIDFRLSVITLWYHKVELSKQSLDLLFFQTRILGCEITQSSAVSGKILSS